MRDEGTPNTKNGKRKPLLDNRFNSNTNKPPQKQNYNMLIDESTFHTIHTKYHSSGFGEWMLDHKIQTPKTPNVHEVYPTRNLNQKKRRKKVTKQQRRKCMPPLWLDRTVPSFNPRNVERTIIQQIPAVRAPGQNKDNIVWLSVVVVVKTLAMQNVGYFRLSD